MPRTTTSRRDPRQHTPHVPVLSKLEERALDKIYLGPADKYSLRTLVNRVVVYHEEWERAHDALRADLARYKEMSNEFTELSRTPMEGRELISHGNHDGSTNVTKWTHNPRLLFETLDKQDPALIGQNPTTPEAWFWHSTMAFGSYTTLHSYVSTTLMGNRRGQSAFIKCYTITAAARRRALRETSAPAPASTSSTINSPSTTTLTPSTFTPASSTPSSSTPRQSKQDYSSESDWHQSSELIPETDVRRYVFRYTVPDPEEHAGAASSPEVYCTWRVVGEFEANDADIVYIVAFDWKSEFETREDMRWDAVRKLISLPTSSRRIFTR